MPRLSVVVPLSASDTASFDDTVASILRNLPDRCQLIVTHDGTYQDPHHLRSIGVQLVQVRGARSYAELCVAALSHCTAPVMHWLRPGVTVDEGWCESAVEQFDNRNVASVTPLIVAERYPDRILAAGIQCGPGYRVRLVGCGNRLEKGERLSPVGPSSWAAFYRHSCLRLVLAQIGSWASDVLDLELALSFRAAGWQNVVDVNSVVSIEQPERVADSYRYIHGRDSQRLLWRHHPGSLMGSLRSTVGAAAAELLTSLVAPRRGLHALQRLAAGMNWSERRDLRLALASLKKSAASVGADSATPLPSRRSAA
jgi:hypothetical protein